MRSSIGRRGTKGATWVLFTALLGACGGLSAGPAPRSGGVANPGDVGLALEPYLLDKTVRGARIAWRTSGRRSSEIRWGRTFTYEAGREVTGPGLQHVVDVVGLEPDAVYYYQVENCFRGRFRTQRAGVERTFAVVSHTQGTEGPWHYPDELLIQSVAGTQPDFVVHTGDATYFCRYEDFRRYYFEPFSILAASTPVYLAPGNHDAGYPFLDEIGLRPFRELFPYRFGTSSPADACYAVSQGSMRLLVVSYLSPLEAGSSQRGWLRERLDEESWDFQGIVFGGSHAMYYDEPSLLDFLVEHGADFVIRGDATHPNKMESEHGGMPMFYVGTGSYDPHTFLHCRLEEGALALRQIRSDGMPGEGAVVHTARRRTPIVTVPLSRVVAESRIVGYIGALVEPLDSARIRGIQFDVNVAEGKAGKVSAIVTPGDRELGSLTDGYPTVQRPDVYAGDTLITMALPNRRIDNGEPFPIKDVKLVFEGLGPDDVRVDEIVLY